MDPVTSSEEKKVELMRGRREAGGGGSGAREGTGDGGRVEEVERITSEAIKGLRATLESDMRAVAKEFKEVQEDVTRPGATRLRSGAQRSSEVDTVT